MCIRMPPGTLGTIHTINIIKGTTSRTSSRTAISSAATKIRPRRLRCGDYASRLAFRPADQPDVCVVGVFRGLQGFLKLRNRLG